MKHYKIILHLEAEVELQKLYSDIADAVSPVIAFDYISGIREFIYKLETFPERGTIRESIIPNLRIIGYKKSISIAFTVSDNKIFILGIFGRGREITAEILEKRQK